MRTHSGFMSSSEQSLLPQLLSAVTFEFQRLTEDGTTVDPSDGLRHGNVRIGEPREPVLRFSSRLHLVRNPVYTGISSLGVGLGFRRDRRESTQVLQVSFAAVRDSLDVAAPFVCSSAIKPKVVMEATGHLFADMIHHPVGFQTASEETGCGTSPARPQQSFPCSLPSAMLTHPGILSRSTAVQPSNRRWFVSSRREFDVTGYRRDRWRRVWERGQIVADVTLNLVFGVIVSLILLRLVSLFCCIQHDMIALGEPIIIRYVLISVTLSAWSFLFSGTKFEYIVAAKPSYGWIPCLWYSSRLTLRSRSPCASWAPSLQRGACAGIIPRTAPP